MLFGQIKRPFDPGSACSYINRMRYLPQVNRGDCRSSADWRQWRWVPNSPTEDSDKRSGKVDCHSIIERSHQQRANQIMSRHRTITVQ